MKKLSQVLGEYFVKVNSIPDDFNYNIEWVSPEILFSLQRIDLVIKRKYAEMLYNGEYSQFISEAYDQHIDVITGGAYIERGKEDEKSCLQDFRTRFQELLRELKEGIDPDRSLIPISEDGIVLDGAHRVAIASVLGISVPVVRVKCHYADWSASSFEKKGLDKKYVDYAVREYCKIKNNIHIACFWPKAVSKDDMLETGTSILANQFRVVYEKEIDLDYKQITNFMIMVYQDFNWLGGLENKFAGATEYAAQVFDSVARIHIVVFEEDSLERVLAIKKEIRDIFDIGNKSLHISDTKEEAQIIADILLSENSIICLSYVEPAKYYRLNILIQDFKNRIKEVGAESDRFIIDSGCVMSLLALRDCDDLDYLTSYDEQITSRIDGNGIECHNYLAKYHKNGIWGLLNDAEANQCYFGMKFVSIQELVSFKESRKESKDADDLSLLNMLGDKNYGWKKKIEEFRYSTKRMIMKTYGKVARFSNKYGILRSCKKIVKRILGK